MGFAYSFTTSNGRTIVGTDALRKYADGLVLGTPEHALWYLSDLHFGVLAAQGRSTSSASKRQTPRSRLLNEMMPSASRTTT